MTPFRTVAGLLTLVLLAVFCYLIPKEPSPTEEWQKTYAPWFGMPVKVLSLEKKMYTSLQDYTVDSHYVLELSEAQVESWKASLKGTGVDVDGDAKEIIISYIFRLKAPDRETAVNKFQLKRLKDADVVGHAIYALNIEYGDWDADTLPTFELAYPEYLESAKERSSDIILSILPLITSISLMLFIWPSILRASFGVMLLKCISFSGVLSFVILALVGIYNPISNWPYVLFVFVSYMIMISILFALLVSLVCGIRCLHTKFGRKA